MAFTAKDVKALREKTGVGMMECKKALTEADGDMDKAIDFLREKGLAAAAKKASRIAAEGVVLSYYDKAAKKAVIVEVNSETDFVAKNEKFTNFVEGVAKTILACAPADVEALADCKYDGTDKTVTETLNELILSIGENMKIRRFETMDGVVSTYVHAGGSVGVLVGFDADAAMLDNADFNEMAKDVAMQVAATAPISAVREDVPQATIDHEIEIYKAQAAESGKPEAIQEKMAHGRLEKFFKGFVLNEQEFIKDSNMTIKQYAEKVSKEVGDEITIVAFDRLVCGESDN